MKDVAFVALGSNLGDRSEYLAMARRELGSLAQSRLLATSAIDETAPIGPVPQGPYLNQMIALETELPPTTLLAELLRIEREAGRTRGVRWGPRTLDLDIVAFERQRVSEPSLVVPHPALSDRDFWQRELADLRAQLAREQAP